MSSNKEQQHGAVPAVSRPIAIQFDRAAVQRNGRTLWRDLTVSVAQGEFVAILGPNGVGKSTLLKVILGLLPLEAGWLSVLGKPGKRGNTAISYLPQRHSFDVDLPIRGRDLVTLGLTGTQWGIPLPGLRRLWRGHRQARDTQRRVQQVIDLVGATAYADRPIGKLSGGEQQRLLIAQALVTRPHILLLDEPLEGLDLTNQRTIAALIRQISHDYQVTVLLVAHDVNPILPYLDCVLYIGQGRAVAGPPSQVITSETLSQLYGTPIDVLQTPDGRTFVAGQLEQLNGHAH